MRPAALTNATPDARALQNRTGSDATSSDDAFDAALAGIVQSGFDPAEAKTGTAPVTPGLALAQGTKNGRASVSLNAGQAVAALLSKVLGGMMPAASPAPGTAKANSDPVASTVVVVGSLVAALHPDLAAASGDRSATKTVKADEDTTATAPVATDPLATMSALLPGLVATPQPVLVAPAAAMIAQAPSDSQKLLSVLGASDLAAASGDRSATKTVKADDDTTATTPVASDPLATMSALLPGLVATPQPVLVAPAAAMVAQAPSASRKLLSVLGATSMAKPADDPRGQAAAEGSKATDEAGVGFALIASSSHLAPLSGPYASARFHAAGTSEAATKDAGAAGKAASAASVAAPADQAHQDATPIEAIATHSEPDAKLPNGTLQAIAGAVTSLVAETAAAPSDPSQSAAARAVVADPAPTPVAPARSLTLQLTPGDLGSVTVRLHLTAGGLDVHLAVDDRNTLASLSHARDELATAIGGNGYSVDSLVIRGTDASSTSTAGSHDSARSQTEAGAGQGFSGGGSGGSDGNESSSRRRAPTAAPRDAVRARGDDGVFV